MALLYVKNAILINILIKIEQIKGEDKMKKIIVGILCLIFMAGSVWAATEYKSNAYQITLKVDTNKIVTFPYDSRSLTIINNDATYSICVDISELNKASTTTVGASGAFVLGAGKQQTFENYITNNISMYPYTGTASPVSVIVTY